MTEQSEDDYLASYEDQLREIGDLADPRLLIQISDADSIDAIHVRNLDHLHAYVRARRRHAGDPCGAGTMCSGPGVSAAIAARDQISGDVYLGHLSLSAIALLDSVMAERDELAARCLRLEMEYAEQSVMREQAEQGLAAAGVEIDELAARVASCEEQIQDVRAGWPNL